MHLISIDPGLSTGVAIFRDGRLDAAFTVGVDQRDELRTLLLGAEVVCEQGPSIRRQADTCEPVEALVKELADNIHWVRPTAWKPSPLAALEPDDAVPDSKHARDAARMGRWFLSCREAERDSAAAAGH